MLTLSYGVQKPQSGDKGSVFWPALEADLQQLNDHTHNGSDSSRLTSKSVTDVTALIPLGSWVATTGGTYRQAVTMPSGMNFDDFGIQFRIASGGNAGHQIYPSVEKITGTTYYVYINDNTIDLTAIYV